jgi:hypothetical protein
MDAMILTGLAAPTLEAEERSDEAASVDASVPAQRPDPEVLAKPKRRRFTAQYRLRILEEANSCMSPRPASGAPDGVGTVGSGMDRRHRTGPAGTARRAQNVLAASSSIP